MTKKGKSFRKKNTYCGKSSDSGSKLEVEESSGKIDSSGEGTTGNRLSEINIGNVREIEDTKEIDNKSQETDLGQITSVHINAFNLYDSSKSNTESLNENPRKCSGLNEQSSESIKLVEGTVPVDNQGTEQNPATEQNNVSFEVPEAEARHRIDGIENLFRNQDQERINDVDWSSATTESETGVIKEQVDLGIVGESELPSDKTEIEKSVGISRLRISQKCEKTGHNVREKILSKCNMRGQTGHASENCWITDNQDAMQSTNESLRWYPLRNIPGREIWIRCETCQGHGYTCLKYENHYRNLRKLEIEKGFDTKSNRSDKSITKNKEYKPIACQLCQRRGHEALNCPNQLDLAVRSTTNNKIPDIVCQICKKPGHGAHKCSFRHFKVPFANPYHPTFGTTIKKAIKRSKTCHHCEQLGHFIRDCPDKQINISTHENAIGNANVPSSSSSGISQADHPVHTITVVTKKC